jgi:hypothetical protein
VGGAPFESCEATANLRQWPTDSFQKERFEGQLGGQAKAREIRVIPQLLLFAPGGGGGGVWNVFFFYLSFSLQLEGEL